MNHSLDPSHADLYFSRTLEILKKDNRNPLVTMEVFARKDGILCGVKEVLGLLKGVLPTTAIVDYLEGGLPFKKHEVVLQITAPYQAFCLYETAYLGILSSETGWATKAHEIAIAAGTIPVVCFGARHVHPNVSAQMEYAAIIGGCQSCATPAGAAMAADSKGKHTNVTPTGTMPHALTLIYGDTIAAAQAFDRNIDPLVARAVLLDTFIDEPEEARKCVEALGEKLQAVRLDTPAELGGVTVKLVKSVRRALDEAGAKHTRILVSGGFDTEKIKQFVDEKAPVDGFGVGTAIACAPPIDFTADIKEIDGKPVAKRGRKPGKSHNPRLRRLDYKELL